MRAPSRLRAMFLAITLIAVGCDDSASNYLANARQLESGGDDKGAVIANQLVPGNPAVMDTLASILMARGKPERAVHLLQQANAKAPDNPEIQYHYAQALVKSGDTTRARNELTRLFATGTAFPQAGEARILLEQLQISRR